MHFLRFLILGMSLWLPVELTAQEWIYAKVKTDRQTGQVTWLKLLPADGGSPFFLLPLKDDAPRVTEWEWMSQEGGIFRSFPAGQAQKDSVSLIAGQQTWAAQKNQEDWSIEDGAFRLWPGENAGSRIWILGKIIRPVPGNLTVPKPVELLHIIPHPRRRNKFDIETVNRLDSTPLPLLQLGIVIALVLEGFPE